MKNNKLVILCATQRCGSTMVVEDLRSTGVLGKAEEYFIPWLPEKQVDWLSNFESIIKRSKTENGISSIKIMANQLQNIEACLTNSNFEEKLNDVMFPYLRTLLKGAVFIRIKRDGVVRQAISRVIAQKTGVNHALNNYDTDYRPGNLLKNNNLNYSCSVGFDGEDIDAEVLNIAKETLLWDEVLKSWNINSPLDLHYEQICKSYPKYINRVVNYVGISSIDLDGLPKTRNLKKLSSDKNEELVTSYLSKIRNDNDVDSNRVRSGLLWRILGRK